MAKIQDIDIPHLEFAEAAAPGTPASGIVRLYAKADGKLYSKDDAGSESALGGGGSGTSRPWLDENPALSGTYGDDFDGASLDGKWTLGADLVSGDLTYQHADGSHLLINIASGGGATADCIYQTSAPGGDFSVYASMTYWFANAGGSTNQFMAGPAILDSSGAGVAAVLYQGNCYTIVLASYKYSSLGNTSPFPNTGDDFGRRIWLRLRKSSGNYYASFSWDGINWLAETAATASGITVARLAVGCYWNNAGQHKLSIGHFNAA